jgi:hypothetical protein
LRQAVKKRQMVDFLLQPLALGDVAQHGHVVGDLSVAILDGGDGDLLGVHLAVLALAPELAVPHARGFNRCPQGVVEIGRVPIGAQHARCLADDLAGCVA